MSAASSGPVKDARSSAPDFKPEVEPNLSNPLLHYIYVYGLVTWAIYTCSLTMIHNRKSLYLLPHQHSRPPRRVGGGHVNSVLQTLQILCLVSLS